MDLTRIQQLQELFTRHAAQVEAIMSSRRVGGLEGTVRFTRREPPKKGKQQAVYITTFYFSEQEVEVVEKHSREDSNTAQDRMQRYPVLDTIFPTILHTNAKGHLAAKVNGLELEPYRNLIATDSQVSKQLFKETYEMFDVVFSQTNLDIYDVDVIRGHNIMYDQDERQFRFFDHDMLQETQRSHAERMLHLFERIVKPAKWAGEVDIEEVTLFAYYLTRFAKEHTKGIRTEITEHQTGQRPFILDRQVLSLANEDIVKLHQYLTRPLEKVEVTRRSRIRMAPLQRPYAIFVPVQS